MPPGKRFDVLVQGGEPGAYRFDTRTFDEGFARCPTQEAGHGEGRGPAARAG